MTRPTDIPGAVCDAGVLQHVGNPLAEQRTLAQGRALALRDDRAVLAVAGDERLSWLDAFCTQRLRDLTPGQSVETLILDPQGHVEHAASVLDDGAQTWLITDAAAAPALLAFLVRMRFRARVEPRDASGGLTVVGGRAAVVEGAGAVVSHGVPLVWHDPWPGVAEGGWAYAAGAHPGVGWDWCEALVDAAARQRLIDAAVAGRRLLAGVRASDALRIAVWRPWLRDGDGRMLPHEVDWLRTAVHLHKGCYRGQETVAKLHNLGHPPRRLVALQLDGSESILPAPGDAVLAGDAPVGTVRASAVHYEDGPIGLALVRRNTPVDASLTVQTAQGPVAAAQEVIVPPDAGATAPVPRLPRLSRRR